ncbi:Qat anti-phage system associated protein QatB [Paenibacillus sp. EC2-1]|uniref:Qat anti-phage system associated protein QatB n=1 Tax=Paenibacillus sp. EC2-1 TaxID=3388665 RepID=UPI003BEECB8B
MGTSSIYNGPGNRNPLLPEGFEDDYVDSEELEQDKNEPKEEENKPKGRDDNNDAILSGSWQETKKSMSQFINGTSNNKGRIVGNYVRASGGSRVASSRAVSGRNTTVNLGSFLSNILRDGIYRTLQSLQIDYVGKSVEDLLSEIVNFISPNSNTKEDIVARNALIEVECKMYELIIENGKDIESLNTLNEEMFDEIMNSYVTSYIFEGMLNDLQSRFEMYGDDTKVAQQKEREFKEFIEISVELKLRDVRLSKVDYQDKSIHSIVKEIYRECYYILEVL